MSGPVDGSVVHLVGAISLIQRFPALAGVDLEVRTGEIVLLRGPNGAGKSTLLRLCAGLAPLSNGVGSVLGHDLTVREQRRRVRRETGLLAHQTFLYDDLTVEENLRFWAAANRVDEGTIEPVLDRLALAGRLRDVKIAGLSAGQRRRASLAVMVSRRPKLWLLDEPHAGLDQAGRDFVDDLVKHAVGFGATVMIASHDVHRATDLATRTVTVAGGLVEDEGQDPPEDRADRSAASEHINPDGTDPDSTDPDGADPDATGPDGPGPGGEADSDSTEQEGDRDAS
ncbi:MAG: heme ABC exporter ATP-binding protein CcmA [Actinomycetota bacterium]